MVGSSGLSKNPWNFVDDDLNQVRMSLLSRLDDEDGAVALKAAQEIRLIVEWIFKRDDAAKAAQEKRRPPQDGVKLVPLKGLRFAG
jgi:uncharacterized protein YecT (DUF1311 family)